MMLGRLKATAAQSERLTWLGGFLSRHGAISFRKLIRHLPDNVDTLYTRDGLGMSTDRFQRTFVVETASPVGKAAEKASFLKAIIENVPIRLDESPSDPGTWPPNDPEYTLQDELYSDPYNIDLPRAWRYTTGNSGVKVAIVDGGFEYTHDDFGGGIGAGYRFRGGWDFTDNDPYPLPGGSWDDHGTPVAGVIGALNGNAEGGVSIAGGYGSVESGVQLFGFRTTCGDNCISTALMVEAVFEAATDPTVNNGFGYGVHVINLSLSGGDDNVWSWSNFYYGTYYDVFVWAWQNNVTVVASRGNTISNPDNSARFPSYYSNAGILLSVAGLRDDGTPHSGSNSGEGVTLSAPYTIGSTTRINNNYFGFSGTSNSAPMVAGVAALVRSRFEERNVTVYADDVREILRISADKSNWTPYANDYGAGRLDAGEALHISSDPFELRHRTASVNRTVTTISNPAQTLGLYYPYNTFLIDRTRKVTATYTVPPEFGTDSTWVWANRHSGGLLWGNPSWGIQGASLVSQSGHDWTFETYVYELREIDGDYIGWYPTHPNNTQIKVSVLGKVPPQPLSVSMPGPSSIAGGEVGTWTANVSGGDPPYSYHWEYEYPCPDPDPCPPGKICAVPDGGITIQAPQCGDWSPTGTSVSLTRSFSSTFGSVRLRARVTDDEGTVRSAQRTISVQGNRPAGENLANSEDGSGARGTDDHSAETRGTPAAGAVAGAGITLPSEPEVRGAIPNPFRGRTEIAFALPEASEIRLVVYDVLGREVVRLAEGDHSAGYHRVGFDASGLPSGVYVVRLAADDFVETARVTVLR